MHRKAYGSEVQIEILHVSGCPNVATARARVLEALRQAGLTASVREIAVTTPEQARQVGMQGSPTILVDGRDPFCGAGPSLGCRLFRDGRNLDGAPAVAALREAFTG